MNHKTTQDLKEVLFRKDLKSKKQIVYRVIRNKKRKGNLRYDITILYPTMLGEEFPKTYGHYHKFNEPELYEILNGEAIFLFQKPEGNSLKIKEVYAVLAQKGDKVVALPGFGMVMINPLNKKLEVGNWIKDGVENIYDDYRKARGAVYYCLKGEKNCLRFIPNKNYKKAPILEFLLPKTLPQKLKNLKFLTDYKKYKKDLTVKNLYLKIE
ncbi:MAG: hypothetical protein N2692_01430 [Patescibacteria group bacterium]|jgi:glucose-6-phosphate isomerase|nr:hypothetical protein [Patescibacteria group bacterium]